MKYNIEILHPDLTAYKLFVNDRLVLEGSCDGSMIFNDIDSGAAVSIWFEPWKIFPRVRINDILINTGLAEISVYDHKLDMTLPEYFFEKYHRNDIDSRIKSVFGKKSYDDTVFDSVIGHGMLHKDLLDEIKTNIAKDDR